jgi:chromosome segregation ATPase
VRQDPKRYVEKKDYGQVPKYITKLKDEIEEEYRIVKDMQAQEEELRERRKYMLPEDERLQLIDALKKKWDVLHHDYQSIITKVTKVNSLGLKNMKENLEKEMEQIEKDIDKLNKKYIFVDSTQ